MIHAHIADYVWSTVIQCVACYFEADDEDKKIYVKATERTIKQVP
jgi:hypothetical protein